MFPVNVIHARAAQLGLSYLIIGGHAVNAYAEPRATLDVDILVSQADRALWQELLGAEGFPLQHDGGNFLQFSPPYGTRWRLDLMMVNAATFAKLFANSRTEVCLGIETRIPSPEHLIALKAHALTHGPADRFEKDFGDILGLIRHTGLSLDSPSLREIMERFGTPELLAKLRERLEPHRHA